ncbi:2OG-Fe(II) oxygenase [Kozakia baliensis]|uniref:2OG-Fe(II) oxygenase n=1 Tax=Kozakia baliensis TaxID=153496 RepID=UPI00345B4F9D
MSAALQTMALPLVENEPSNKRFLTFERASDPKAYAALRKSYQEAKPFPHLILDGLFPEDLLRSVVSEYDSVTPENWTDFDTPLQLKKSTVFNPVLPEAASSYFDFVNSKAFIRFLCEITGMPLLIPDPYLFGGGLHEVPAGGRFDIHVDFQQHPLTGLRNRLAMLTYLNEDWASENGGALELWQTDPNECKSKILPLFGRTVLMSQSAVAAHGYPNPLGEGLRRRTLITYYYSAQEAAQGHSSTTTYLGYPGQSSVAQLQRFLRSALPQPVTQRMLSAYRAMRRNFSAFS